jgi:riboflavin synthase
MFTGIVTELGTVESAERAEAGARLRIRAELAGRLDVGDSVAVEGACLTVAAAEPDAFEADVMNQTLGLTTLGRLAAGDRVNLEPALRAGQPLGGHLVQGHVDGLGEVISVAEDGIAKRLRVRLADGLDRYAVEHGSVSLSGVSLTVAGLAAGEIEVSLVPETLARTTLGRVGEGDLLNVELDLVARYVERLLRFNQEESGNV